MAAGPAPLCVDEYQRVPDILDALKARLNRDGSLPGTAVITGSTRQDTLPATAQALTGRLHALTIWPLSQKEIAGVRENLLEALRADPEGTVSQIPTSATPRADYVNRVCAGGLPLALRRSGAARDLRRRGDSQAGLLAGGPVALGHWRISDGVEVDLVIEHEDPAC